jgi:hypothetical protein
VPRCIGTARRVAHNGRGAVSDLISEGFCPRRSLNQSTGLPRCACNDDCRDVGGPPPGRLLAMARRGQSRRGRRCMVVAAPAAIQPWPTPRGCSYLAMTVISD